MEKSFSTQPKWRHCRRDSIDLPPFMDLCSKCPICLDVLTDPVTTPCGHNFCKSCLKDCWDNSQDYKCLHCKETFRKRPDLKSNTVLREVVQLCEKNTPAQLCINGPLSEELQCSICLDLFIDPVTTPCGHNFCKTCLEMFWYMSQKSNCPFCNVTFGKCPDLKCNTALGVIVQLFQEKTGYKRELVTTEYSQTVEIQDEEETLCKPSVMDFSSSVLAENLQCLICLEVSTDPINTPCGHIFCKACLKECWESSHDNTCPCCKQKFTKRVDLTHCEHLLSQSETLMWQSSNLEPLKEVLNIKQVMMLVEDINPKIIQNYNRALKMFSREDQTSVIQSCAEGDHKTYNKVLVEDDIKEKKTQEMKMRKLVQQMIQDTIKIDREINHSEIKTSKKKEADDTELCTDLNFATEKCQTQKLTILKPLQQMILETMKIDQEIIHSKMKMLKKSKNEEKEEADHIELCTDLNCATEKYQIQELKILKLVQRMIQDTVKMEQKISKKSKEKADKVADLNYLKYQDDAF